MEIRFIVWQFVRVMDQIEKSICGKPKSDPLHKIYDLWEDVWVDLNARLADLGLSDIDGFAEVMMNQDVVCDDVSIDQAKLFTNELRLVVKTMSQTLLITDDPEVVTDISFERDELQLLINSLDKKTKDAQKC